MSYHLSVDHMGVRYFNPAHTDFSNCSDPAANNGNASAGGDGLLTNNITINCSTMCLNLMETPESWPLWLFVIGNSLLFLCALYLLKTVKTWKSIRGYLLCVQLAALGVRIVCNSVKIQWGYVSLVLVEYTLPQYLQFLTFILLAYFIINMYVESLEILSHRRHRLKVILFAALLVIIVAMLALDIGLVLDKYCEGLSGHHASCARQLKYLDKGTAKIMAPLFMILSVALGLSCYFAMRVYSNSDGDYKNIRKEVRLMTQIMLIYTVTFFARSIWAITYIACVNKAENYIAYLSTKENKIPYHLAFALFYFFFEMLPAGLLLFTIHRLDKGLREVDSDGDNDDDSETAGLPSHFYTNNSSNTHAPLGSVGGPNGSIYSTNSSGKASNSFAIGSAYSSYTGGVHQPPPSTTASTATHERRVDGSPLQRRAGTSGRTAHVLNHARGMTSTNHSEQAPLLSPRQHSSLPYATSPYTSLKGSSRI